MLDNVNIKKWGKLMEEFIVIDTQTGKIVLQSTTCHNAIVYAEFLNDYGKSNRYKYMNKNNL